jgi:hypothetical protein
MSRMGRGAASSLHCDLAQLEAWFGRAATVATPGDVFG